MSSESLPKKASMWDISETLYGSTTKVTVILRKMFVDVWGRVVGLKKYEGVLGNEITIPEINSLHIELVGHAK